MSETDELKQKLHRGINNETFTIKPKIENENYFVKGLIFLITDNRRQFTENVINRELTTNFLKFKNHLKGFLKLCKSLNYINTKTSKDSTITVYSSNIKDDKYATLIEKYGLIKVNGLNKLNKLNNANDLYNEINKLKTFYKNLNNSLNNNDDAKLSEDEFIDTYLKIKKVSNDSIKSSQLLDTFSLKPSDAYDYIISSKTTPENNKYGNSLQNLNNLKFQSFNDAKKFVDWVYNELYITMLTNKDGYLVSFDEYIEENKIKLKENNLLNELSEN